MKRTILLFGITIVLSNVSYSQDSIGIKAIYNFPDTILYNRLSTTNHIVYDVVLQNKGSSTINKNIQINIAVKSPINTVLSTISAAKSVYANNLKAGDTLLVPIKEQLDLNNYSFPPSKSTIVIWPTASGAVTVDSVKVSTYIDATTAILYPYVSDNITLINRRDNVFYFKINDNKESIKQISITDINGKEISVTSFQQEISLNNYPDGIYFISFLLNDNRQEIFKVAKY